MRKSDDGGVVSQPTLGVIPGINVVSLKPSQKTNHQYQHDYVAADQQEMHRPVLLVVWVAIPPTFLGDEMHDERLKLAQISRQRNGTTIDFRPHNMLEHLPQS